MSSFGKCIGVGAVIFGSGLVWRHLAWGQEPRRILIQLRNVNPEAPPWVFEKVHWTKNALHFPKIAKISGIENV